MIKITHLTSAHKRDDIRIFAKMCNSLAKIEHYSVSLIVADGRGDEIKNNVTIIDVGATIGGRLTRMTKTVKKVFAKAKELDSDIYHFHDPELIPIGLKLKKLGKKVIFDIHENTELQILEKDWIPFLFRKLFSLMYKKYENYACKKFDAVIVPQEAMFKKYNDLIKTIVIGNFPNKITYNDLSRNNYCKFRLLYSGAISKPRGFFNMLNLIDELNKIDTNYKLTLAGPMSSDLLKEAKKYDGWKNTEYLGVLSKKEIYKIYAENSIGLILFNNVGQYFMAYSLKLFEYMQNGMYVIMPNFGDWVKFNQTYKVGLNVDVSNARQIAKQIHQLNKEQLYKIGKNNMENVNKYFSWKSQEKKLFKIYKELINANEI